jgi:tetratricopeptide (TPR) repeat protein
VAGLIPLAGWALASFWEKLKKKNIPHSLILTMLIAVGWGLSHLPLFKGEHLEITHFNMGLIYANQGWKDKAEEEYRASIQADPRFKNSYLNLGTLLIERRDYHEALKILEQAIPLETDPNQKLKIQQVVDQLKKT